MVANGTSYVYKRDLTKDENKVMKGLDIPYPFVSTITLKAGKPLNLHLHHSANTHYIVAGTLFLNKRGLRAKKYEARSVITMEAGVEYQAWAGDKGCTFVEGHTVLSPKTADRFVDCGTIARDTANSPSAFYVVVPQE